MPRRFREIKEKGDQLLEKGRMADLEVERCQTRVSAAAANVTAAKNHLAAAVGRQTVAGGIPVDVARARAQLVMAEEKLAASQRALKAAKDVVDRVNNQKESHVRDIERHNKVEKSNLERLQGLREYEFSENSATLAEGIAERHNEAENVRIELLSSMGKKGHPDYVSSKGPKSCGFGWIGEGFSTVEDIFSSEGSDRKGLELGGQEFPISFEVPKNSQERERIRERIRQGVVTEKEIRFIGQCVREKYNQVMSAKDHEYKEIQKEEYRLANENRRAKTIEEIERVESDRKNLIQRENEFSAKYNSANVMRKIFSQYRDIGPKAIIDTQIYQENTSDSVSAEVIKAIDHVHQFVPTDWIRQSIRRPIIVKHVNRGYFWAENSNDVVAIGGEKDTQLERCAFHEMGHRFENLYPEILKIENQFYVRRTNGEQLSWLGPGYAESELTRFDNFIDPYMGKDYGGTGYELLSMGMEGLFCGTFPLSQDTEFEDLIFGIMAAI